MIFNRLKDAKLAKERKLQSEEKDAKDVENEIMEPDAESSVISNEVHTLQNQLETLQKVL